MAAVETSLTDVSALQKLSNEVYKTEAVNVVIENMMNSVMDVAQETTNKTATLLPNQLLALEYKNPSLPTARQLSKHLCKIVQSDNYTLETVILALNQLEAWAKKAKAQTFAKDFVDLGGVLIVMHYLEDHVSDSECVRACLGVLVALSKVNNKVFATAANHSGVDIFMKAFEIHVANKKLSPDASKDDFFKKVQDMYDAMNPLDKKESLQSKVVTAFRIIKALELIMPSCSIEQSRKIYAAMSNITPKVDHDETLTASVLDFMVAASDRYKLKDPKETTKLTIRVMKQYPNSNKIAKEGCILLSQTSSQLSKSERKQIGMVEAIGAVLASDTLSAEVKEFADKILEEKINATFPCADA